MQANCPHLLLLETSSTRHFNIPGILHVLLHAACPESELMHMERDEIPRVSEVTSFSVSAKFCSVKHFQQPSRHLCQVKNVIRLDCPGHEFRKKSTEGVNHSVIAPAACCIHQCRWRGPRPRPSGKSTFEKAGVLELKFRISDQTVWASSRLETCCIWRGVLGSLQISTDQTGPERPRISRTISNPTCDCFNKAL